MTVQATPKIRLDVERLAEATAHAICAKDCFAFTGEGPKPHSKECRMAKILVLNAMNELLQELKTP